MLGVDILEVHDDVVLQKLAKALVLTPQQVEKQLKQVWTKKDILLFPKEDEAHYSLVSLFSKR